MTKYTKIIPNTYLIYIIDNAKINYLLIINVTNIFNAIYNMIIYEY